MKTVLLAYALCMRIGNCKIHYGSGSFLLPITYECFTITALIKLTMKIEKIEHANIDLVEIRNGTSHCKKHGAMNKITKDGFWRCITVSGFSRATNGNSISEKHVETICRAGCLQV
jgi:hypothetical protein